MLDRRDQGVDAAAVGHITATTWIYFLQSEVVSVCVIRERKKENWWGRRVQRVLQNMGRPFRFINSDLQTRKDSEVQDAGMGCLLWSGRHEALTQVRYRYLLGSVNIEMLLG